MRTLKWLGSIASRLAMSALFATTFLAVIAFAVLGIAWVAEGVVALGRAIYTWTQTLNPTVAAFVVGGGGLWLLLFWMFFVSTRDPDADIRREQERRRAQHKL